MKETSEIIFSNETLIAINKPPGILSVPDRYNIDRFSIATWITKDYPEARPLHRIDYETSGILLFCLKPEAFGWYSDQFESRTVKKTYQAITEERAMQDGGVIDQPLYTTSTGKVVISKRGKESKTEWHLLERFINHTFIEVRPLTGRTHQIRVHLSSVGLPILGDITYGSKGPLFLSSLKGKKRYRLGKDEETERPLFNRTALHAASIGLLDFFSKDLLTIEAPLPKDMMVTLQKLKQYTSVNS